MATAPTSSCSCKQYNSRCNPLRSQDSLKDEQGHDDENNNYYHVNGGGRDGDNNTII